MDRGVLHHDDSSYHHDELSGFDFRWMKNSEPGQQVEDETFQMTIFQVDQTERNPYFGMYFGAVQPRCRPLGQLAVG